MNERYVPAAVDAAKSPRLTEALRIQAYPTMIIAAADGKILAFLEGYQDARPLHDHLQRALAVQTPDWMARDFQEASKAIAAGEYAKAVSLLKKVLEDGKDRPVQTKAKAVLDEIEQQAAGRLVRVKQLEDKGQYAEAMDLLTELISRYAGTQPAADGAKTLTTLAERPEFKTNQRARRAKDLLAQAREAFAAQQYSDALEFCEILETTYKDLPEGQRGAELAGEIRSSPDKLAGACEKLNERLAQHVHDARGDLAEEGRAGAGGGVLREGGPGRPGQPRGPRGPGPAHEPVGQAAGDSHSVPEAGEVSLVPRRGA